MKATVTTLTGLQQSITQNNSGFSLSFSVQGTQVSANPATSTNLQPRRPDCRRHRTGSEARGRAGLNLGGILAMSSIGVTRGQ